jgi:hypothetical protein
MKLLFRLPAMLFAPSHRPLRTFAGLYLRYGKRQRMVTTKLKCEGVDFQVVDCKSFVWQYYDIFVRRYYDFITTETCPRIIDCGSNVGTSLLRYSMLYPKAHVTAFEPDEKVFQTLSQNASQLQGRLELVNKAVWIHDEGVRFVDEGADTGHISESHQGKLIPSQRLRTLLNQEAQDRYRGS